MIGGGGGVDGLTTNGGGCDFVTAGANERKANADGLGMLRMEAFCWRTVCLGWISASLGTVDDRGLALIVENLGEGVLAAAGSIIFSRANADSESIFKFCRRCSFIRSSVNLRDNRADVSVDMAFLLTDDFDASQLMFAWVACDEASAE